MGNKKRGGGGVNDQNPLNEIKAPVRIPLFGVESFSFNESAKKKSEWCLQHNYDSMLITCGYWRNTPPLLNPESTQSNLTKL